MMRSKIPIPRRNTASMGVSLPQTRDRVNGEDGQKRAERVKSYVASNRKAREDPTTPTLEQVILAGKAQEKHKIIVALIIRPRVTLREPTSPSARVVRETFLLGAAKKQPLLTISIKDHDLTSNDEG